MDNDEYNVELHCSAVHGKIYVVSTLELFYMACMLEAGLDNFRGYCHDVGRS